MNLFFVSGLGKINVCDWLIQPSNPSYQARRADMESAGDLIRMEMADEEVVRDKGRTVANVNRTPLLARLALVIIVGGALGYGSSFLSPCKRAITTPAKTGGVITMTDGAEVDVRLKSPFTAIVAGPTGSGKTRMLTRLIMSAAEVADPPPAEIIYCYGAWQEGYESLRDRVRFHEGMMDVKEEIPADGRNRWLIVDDLMEEAGASKNTSSVYTKYSHHRNVSVFMVVQNLFFGGRTASINSHYFFLFKNPRDATGVRTLFTQMFPTNWRYAMESYTDATKQPHGFLLVDLKPQTPDDRRLLGNYGTDDMTVYTPKNGTI